MSALEMHKVPNCKLESGSKSFIRQNCVKTWTNFQRQKKTLVFNEVKKDNTCSLPLQIKSLCTYVTSDPPTGKCCLHWLLRLRTLLFSLISCSHVGLLAEELVLLCTVLQGEAGGCCACVPFSGSAGIKEGPLDATGKSTTTKFHFQLPVCISIALPLFFKIQIMIKTSHSWNNRTEGKHSFMESTAGVKMLQSAS